eukprot:SAG31_NODE_40049_length_283_cov_1.385870_1_plen_35_part_01
MALVAMAEAAREAEATALPRHPTHFSRPLTFAFRV